MYICIKNFKNYFTESFILKNEIIDKEELYSVIASTSLSFYKEDFNEYFMEYKEWLIYNRENKINKIFK